MIFDWQKIKLNSDKLEISKCPVATGLLNVVSSGIMILDMDYKIIHINRFFEWMLKTEQEIIVGTNFKDITGHLDKELIGDLFKKALETKQIAKKINIKHLKPKDMVHLIDMAVMPFLNKHDEVIGFAIIAESSMAKKEFIASDYRMQVFVRYIFDAMNEGATVIDEAGNLEYANQKFFDLLGYDPKELLTQHWSAWVYEYDMEQIEGRKVLKNEQKNNGISVYFLRLVKKNGDLLPVKLLVSKNVDKDFNIKSIGVIADLTEKEKLETDFKEVSYLNSKVLETITTGIITLDSDLTIKSLNRQVEILFKKKLLDVQGMRLVQAFPSLEIFEEWSGWVLRSRKPYQVDRYKLNVPDEDELLFINARINPLADDEGNITGVVCAFDDVTISARLEEKIELSYRKLEMTHSKLTNLLKRQSEFLADVSHELRTPLTIIGGNVEVSLQDKNTTREELIDVMQLVQSEAERMSRMVSDLMTLTKMEAGEIIIKYDVFPLESIAQDIMGRIDYFDKGLKTVSFSRVDRAMVRGDKDKIRALLWNLIENGLKYSGKEGVVEIKMKSSKKDPNNIRLTVEDNGMGIAKQELENIFDRFYRVEKSRARERGGSGLGLSICKSIAEAHRGKIRVKSKVGEGTKFIVDLPIRVG